MDAKQNSDPMRPRTIRWETRIDKLAVRLAAERGCHVSELLEQLVEEESQNPRLEIEEPTVGYAKLLRAASQSSKTKK